MAIDPISESFWIVGYLRGAADSGEFLDVLSDPSSYSGESINYQLVAYDSWYPYYSNNVLVYSTAPAPPELAATATGSGVQLTWTGSSSFTELSIYRETAYGSELIHNGPSEPGMQSFSDSIPSSTVSYGETVGYRMVLLDWEGLSYSSNLTQVEYKYAPSITIWYEGYETSMLIYVEPQVTNWNECFYLQASYDGGATWTYVNNIYGGGSPLLVSGNLLGSHIYFRTNIPDTELYGEPTLFETPIDTPVLTAGTFNANTEGMSLSWQSFNGNGVEYVLERSLDGGPFEELFVSSGSQSIDFPWELNTPLLFSVPPAYRVKARNPREESEYSNILAIPPGTLTISDTVVNLAAGAEIQFSASGFDPFGREISGGSIEWYGGGLIDASGFFAASSAAGVYTVTAKARGLSATADVTVIDETPPTVSTYGPLDGSTTFNRRTTIFCNLQDGSGISLSNLTASVDQSSIPFTLTNSGFTFTPQDDLAAGSHIVYLSAEDNAGNSITFEWSFTVGIPLQIELIATSGTLPSSLTAIATYDGIDVSQNTEFYWFGANGEAEGPDLLISATLASGDYTVQALGIWNGLETMSAEYIFSISRDEQDASVLQWGGVKPGGDIGGPKSNRYAYFKALPNQLDIYFGRKAQSLLELKLGNGNLAPGIAGAKIVFSEFNLGKQVKVNFPAGGSDTTNDLGQCTVGLTPQVNLAAQVKIGFMAKYNHPDTGENLSESLVITINIKKPMIVAIADSTVGQAYGQYTEPPTPGAAINVHAGNAAIITVYIFTSSVDDPQLIAAANSPCDVSIGSTDNTKITSVQRLQNDPYEVLGHTSSRFRFVLKYGVYGDSKFKVRVYFDETDLGFEQEIPIFVNET